MWGRNSAGQVKTLVYFRTVHKLDFFISDISNIHQKLLLPVYLETHRDLKNSSIFIIQLILKVSFRFRFQAFRWHSACGWWNQENESFAVPVELINPPTRIVSAFDCVNRQRCFVSLSGNQLKISDVCKILFRDLFYLSLLEPCEKTILHCGEESEFWVNLRRVSILYKSWSIRYLNTLHS